MDHVLKTQSSFHQYKEYVQDLRPLVDIDLLPILDQMDYQISQLQNPSTSTLELFQDYQDFLCIHFYQLIKKNVVENIRYKNKINNITFIVDEKKLIFTNVVRIFKNLNYFNQLLSMIDFVDNIKVNLSSDNLELSGKFKGKLFSKKEVDDYKKINKNLLKNKIIMTYDLEVDPNVMDHSYYYIRFNLYLYDTINDTHVITFPWDVSNGLSWGLSSQFQKYIVKREEIPKSMNSPRIIEISDQLNIKIFDKNDILNKNFEGYTFLHFPFFFAPFSVIIPDRGNIFPRSIFSKILTTNGDLNEIRTVQNQDSQVNLYLFEVDLFDLI